MQWYFCPFFAVGDCWSRGRRAQLFRRIQGYNEHVVTHMETMPRTRVEGIGNTEKTPVLLLVGGCRYHKTLQHSSLVEEPSVSSWSLNFTHLVFAKWPSHLSTSMRITRSPWS